MRLALVDYYSPAIYFKDPTQITLGFRELGCDAIFVARNPVSGRDVAGAPFPVVTGGALESAEFWCNLSLDAVLLISRLDAGCMAIAEAIKSAGPRLLVKADSDGTLGYPLIPNYLRILSWRKEPLRTLLRHAKWRLPIRKYICDKIDQIALADSVIIESTKARDNVSAVLRYWGRSDLVSRIFFVPNPVAPDILAVVLKSNKDKTVIAVGRWEDTGPKNTEAMVKAIVLFLRARPDYNSLIVGTGQLIVEGLIHRFDATIGRRIDVIGPVDHGRLAEKLARCRVLFMPSRLESFGIAAAEALCLGCSIAVTPVESLEYLAADGFSGTVAGGFDARSAMSAILAEAELWDVGKRFPENIAEVWRAHLDRKVIARQLLDILTNPDLENVSDWR